MNVPYLTNLNRKFETNPTAFSLLAQKLILPGSSGAPAEFQGPIPTLAGGGYKYNTIADIVRAVMGLLYPAAALILFAYLLYGGFQYLTSAGEEKAMAAAKGRITMAILGFVLLLVSYWIVQLVFLILNVKAGGIIS